ncbi:unnamed protein product, partial [Rotaria magnacalcarata]
PQTAPTTYEVKRGGKIYKVVVGYVSPFTSPLQRQELHLKTYEVKRGGKIYKVVVGYVSPFTSPLQRQELHLKTRVLRSQSQYHMRSAPEVTPTHP